MTTAIVCGAGAAGIMHAFVLRSAGARIVGVYDPDSTRSRALAELTGAHVCLREDELFDTASDIACITSPPTRHVEQAELAARGGRLVLVEKPVATTRQDLARLAVVPRCVPILQWRAGRALRAVRAAVARGELGPAPTVGVDMAWSRDDAYFAAGRGTRAAWGCGVLLSVGVHAVDAVCWTLGQRVAEARGLLGYGRGEVETRAVMHVGFDRGALASFRATFEAGSDATRLCFAGGGVSAIVEGGELDPTAGAVKWVCDDEDQRARLEAIERGAGGATAPPLLVPYLHDALSALAHGAEPGACDALPGVAEVIDAHRAVLAVYG
jgi:predicted dehydrogenase